MSTKPKGGTRCSILPNSYIFYPPSPSRRQRSSSTTKVGENITLRLHLNRKTPRLDHRAPTHLPDQARIQILSQDPSAWAWESARFMTLPLDTKRSNGAQDIRTEGLDVCATEKGEGPRKSSLNGPCVHEIVEYCVQDVMHLPKLSNECNGKLRNSISLYATWARRVTEASEERVELSELVGFDGDCMGRDLGRDKKPDVNEYVCFLRDLFQ